MEKETGKKKTTRLARVKVLGLVQGVGFRPFIYQLAHEYGLKGWVRNTSGSVDIEVEGDETGLRSFIKDIEKKSPPQARIQGVHNAFDELKGYDTFKIQESLSQENKYQIVSPDIATCLECREEISSRDARRFSYPFTNCTNCGPRFTIIKDIPYDRASTTMAKFTMCQHCRSEYNDPLDRRFHAEPIACPNCGPAFELLDETGTRIPCANVLQEASRLLQDGKILAIKGLGGFQLACNATNAAAVETLRVRKKRPAKPFAVMLASIDGVKQHCSISLAEQKLLQSPECPIVLLRWLKESNIVTAVAPNLKYLGVMLPYTPLHHILLNEVRIPLVMTSGNLSEEPIARDNDEALNRLSGIADYFLMHNRDIYARYDDSVYLVEQDKPRAVRRARGYAPYPIFLPFTTKQILACGAEEKNTFCLTKDENAFLSQHIGDLENEETLEHFAGTIELYQKLFRVEPQAIAYDMHPEYLSTKYALEASSTKNLPAIPVQHHHAHIASCLADNGAEGPVIGVAFDGTGYGLDGAIWGGEFLLADYRRFQRLGHLEYVPMPGGAAAIRKPYRMMLGYVYTLLGEDTPLPDVALQGMDSSEREIIKQQIKRRLNSPLTSSCGRLFDAVAVLLGVRQEIQYEAQAAIELEMLALEDSDTGFNPYPYAIAPENGVKVIKLGELLSAIIKNVRDNVPKARIARRFHVTVADIVVQTCLQLSLETGLRRVALSGGVFQNRLLFRLITAALEKAKLAVLTHNLVPCNDGGIALGQAVIADRNLQ